MLKLGVALIAIAVILVAVAFFAAVAGFGTIAAVAFTAAKFSPILLIPGIVLVAVGASRRGSQSVS